MELERMNLTELSFEEKKEKNGGNIWIEAGALFVAVEAGLYALGKDLGRTFKKLGW